MKKPEHVSDAVWKQHLNWMQVVNEEQAVNMRRFRAQLSRLKTVSCETSPPGKDETKK